MFNRFSTALTLTTLMSWGSWGAIAIPPALAQGRSVHAQRWRRPRPTFRPSYPGRRPSYYRSRTYRRPPGLYTSRNRRLPFLVGAHRSYRRSFYVGGISRNAACPSGTNQLKRLVPPAIASEVQESAKFLPTDRTMAARPTFFAALPQLPPGIAEITIQRQEQQGGDFFKGEFELTGEAGIVGVQLPNEAPALDINQPYLWQIAVRCNPEKDENQWVIVEGWIERVPEKNFLGAEDPAEFYAKQGIWQDVLEMMAILRYEKPEDAAIAQQWSDLMTSAQLAQFADTPVVQIAVPQ